jgi:hypothetical protein
MTIYYCEQCAEAPADTILHGDALCETCAQARARIDVRELWAAKTKADAAWRRWELR